MSVSSYRINGWVKLKRLVRRIFCPGAVGDGPVLIIHDLHDAEVFEEMFALVMGALRRHDALRGAVRIERGDSPGALNLLFPVFREDLRAGEDGLKTDVQPAAHLLLRQEGGDGRIGLEIIGLEFVQRRHDTCKRCGGVKT